MILLCDEDIGTGVPNSLASVGCPALALVDLGWGGWRDIRWLTKASKRNLLVFSCNKRMLFVPEERETIIREKVGIVFLTNGEEHPANVLRLLLGKWDLLKLTHATLEKPFARFLSPRGRFTEKYRRFSLF